jgi:1,4-dihydroxy-2-naphthoate octaprenyltransferase
MSEQDQPVTGIKKWLIAARPFSFTASVVAVLLGLAVSYHMGYPILWGPFLLTLIGMLSFQVAANLLNDCYDHRRKLDTQVFPTSGAVVRGLISESEAFRAALVCLAVGTVCGLVLVKVAGPVVLLLGIIGTVIALGYTTARFCFKYVGLGDAAIFCAFGILPVFGTYWVQARAFSWQPILWSIPLVLVTVGILHANNWRDIESDRAKGCRTFAGVLGERGSRIYHHVLVLLPFALTAGYVIVRCAGGVEMVAPLSVLVALVALPSAVKLARIDRTHHAEAFVALDGATAQLQLKLGLLLTVALIVSRHLPAPW